MPKIHPSIDEATRRFIRAQSMFFVGSAPLDAAGHINISPKGLDTFRILGPTTVAYLDFTGSGVETIAHIRENQRVVLMFCAFQGPPTILRLHGLGSVIDLNHPKFVEMQSRFPAYEGARAVIVVEVRRISTSCGYGVPLLRYEGERRQLTSWCESKGAEGLEQYRIKNNQYSIDDLPAMETL